MELFFKEPLIEGTRWFFGLQPRLVRTKHQPKELSISVVIPAHNEEKSIADTIQSIQHQTYPVSEIIVVDDFSDPDDKTGDIARSLGATVIRTPKNQGTKAKAQNFALPYLTTDLFTTIDADTTLAPDAIEKTMRYFNDPDAYIVCGMIVPQKIETIWERGRFIEYLWGLSIIKPAQNHNRVVVVASGCFSVFRTKPIIEEFGGFQSRTMAEDMDLTWQVHATGKHVYFAPEAKCYPVEPPDFERYWKQVARWSRSFFQNIMVRKGYKFGSLRLGFVLYAYFLWGVAGPFMTVFVVWRYTNSLVWAVELSLLAQMSLIWVPAVIKAVQLGEDDLGLGFKEGSRKKNMVWEAIKSGPCFLLTQYINMAVFFYALWKEVIVRDKLNTWDKGH